MEKNEVMHVTILIKMLLQFKILKTIYRKIAHFDYFSIMSCNF